MERLIIKGGTRLEGEIRVGSAKNAILPVMAACLLTSEGCLLEEVPFLKDTCEMEAVLKHLGARVARAGRSLEINCRLAGPEEVGQDLMRRLRASNLVLGPLLGRFGMARVAYPGGCDIGSRPMDLHLKGFRSLGATVEESAGYIEIKSSSLRGADIHLDFPSVGATENIMMAAVLAEGITVIRNAAREPEIVDLQNFLNKLGARIRGAGLDTIRVEGVKALGGASHRSIPDRIEAGTHAVAAVITGGNLLVKNVIPEHLEPVSAKLREAGAEVREEGEAIRVKGKGRPRSIDFKTMPYPGFPTDMQPQAMALMCLGGGASVFVESIFDNRFRHVQELRRMGADIRVEGRTAIVKGVDRLNGALVEASDLRAGAALVLAAMAAEGVTVLEKVYHLDRGYEELEEKYNAVGACITRSERCEVRGVSEG